MCALRELVGSCVGVAKAERSYLGVAEAAGFHWALQSERAVFRRCCEGQWVPCWGIVMVEELYVGVMEVEAPDVRVTKGKGPKSRRCEVKEQACPLPLQRRQKAAEADWPTVIWLWVK